MEAAAFHRTAPPLPTVPQASHIPGIPPALMELSLAAASCLEEKSNSAGHRERGWYTRSPCPAPVNPTQAANFTSEGASQQHIRIALYRTSPTSHQTI